MSKFAVVGVFGLDDDASVRSVAAATRTVAETYARGLADQGIDNRHRELRLFLIAAQDDGRDVVVEVDDAKEGFESASVQVPDGLAAAGADAVAWLALDVVHTAVDRLAVMRGWPADAARVAREHALAHGLLYRETMPWRAGRRRGYLARPVFWIDRLGRGWVSLEMRTESSTAVCTRSPQVPTHPTPEGFRRVTRTLRWEDAAHVVIEPEGAGRQLRLAATAQAAPEPVIRLVRAEPAPDERVEVRLHVLDPTAHGIRFVGGGPVDSSLPPRYLPELERLLGQLRGQEWTQWWRGAPQRVLEIWWEARSDRDAVVARRVADRLVVTVKHTRAGVEDREGADLARADVTALLALVRTRMGLGPTPPLK